MTNSASKRLPTLALVLILAVGCEEAGSTPKMDWAVVQDSGAVFPLRESATICLDCIDLQRLVVMGDTDGPGYVEYATWLVSDSLGRYWITQNGFIKVFDATGKFVRQVGRQGGGPLEFSYPLVVHTDSAGNVHAFDAGNIRETVIDANFTLRAEITLLGITGVNDVAPLTGGHAYAINSWLPTADGVGLPIHIMRGGKIQYSFGASEAIGLQNPFKARRLLAVDPLGRIFSVKRFDYEIEAWTNTGRRITGFTGPQLNAREVLWTFYNRDDNPIPSEIHDIQVDGAGRIWIMSRRVKDNWQAHYVDYVYPDGRIGIRLKPGSTQDSVRTTRIEVIDLQSRTIIARRDGGPFLTGFLGQGLLFENRSTDNGIPQIAVWRVTLESARR